MKKISILSLHLGYGGIERCVSSLANALCREYEVEIACCYKLYDKPAFPIDKRVTIKYLNGDIKPNKDKFMSSLKGLHLISTIKEGVYSLKVLNSRRSTMVKYISNCKSDVIISTRDLFNYWVGTFANSNIIKIGWEHNHFHGNNKYATSVVNSCRGLDYLIVVSHSLQEYYANRFKRSKFKCKCLYIPNTIDKVPSKLSSLTNKRLISVGRLSPEKGFMDLLRVYKVVSNTHPDWCLDIIGDGVEKERLEYYIKKNNLEGKVILHGFQNEEYISQKLDSSSIYVMTSFTESFGIVLIEAMSHGVPCIAFSSAEGASEIINSGYNGYLINNRSIPAMAGKINDLIDSLPTRKALGKNARDSVNKYTIDVVRKSWINLIETGDINE